MRVIPVTLRAANAFVLAHHRHSKPDRGHRWSIGLEHAGQLVGVAVIGRPKARALDDGLTVEVCRTCTDGTHNANSMLYGAAWRATRAMGYWRSVTYTQADESGASLRAAGYVCVREIEPRTAEPRMRAMRDPVGTGGVARRCWMIWTCQPQALPADLLALLPDVHAAEPSGSLFPEVST